MVVRLHAGFMRVRVAPFPSCFSLALSLWVGVRVVASRGLGDECVWVCSSLRCLYVFESVCAGQSLKIWGALDVGADVEQCA